MSDICKHVCRCQKQPSEDRQAMLQLPGDATTAWDTDTIQRSAGVQLSVRSAARATTHFSTPLPEEKGVIDHYQKHCVYLPTGRFKVALPRRTDAPPLGESRRHVLEMFHSNECSVLRKGNWATFQEVVQEYLDLGHAEPVPPTPFSSPASSHYYLPMHGVVKNSSTSTKLRVLYDASAKTTSCVSLNDTLLVGLALFKPIDHILLKFRMYIVAISGDIGKTYRAVELEESDKEFHHFLWRTTKNGPTKDYCMTRVTFGVTSSPFLAI